MEVASVAQPCGQRGRCAIKPRSAGDFYVGPHETRLACEVFASYLAVRCNVRRVAPSRLGLLVLSVQGRAQRSTALLRRFRGHHRVHRRRVVLLSVAVGSNRYSFGRISPRRFRETQSRTNCQRPFALDTCSLSRLREDHSKRIERLPILCVQAHSKRNKSGVSQLRSNPAVDPVHFALWTLRDEAAQRR
jgi:hypothetical protein